METTITRKIKADQISKMFNESNKINIKYYNFNHDDIENGFDPNKLYPCNILITHNDNTNPENLFDKEFNRLFNRKSSKTFKKRIFMVVTERGRIHGKISFYIAEIEPFNGLRLIDNNFTCNISSNKGIKNEALKVLIKYSELPESVLENGYINTEIKNYQLIIVEGLGINYVEQVN